MSVEGAHPIREQQNPFAPSDNVVTKGQQETTTPRSPLPVSSVVPKDLSARPEVRVEKIEVRVLDGAGSSQPSPIPSAETTSASSKQQHDAAIATGNQQHQQREAAAQRLSPPRPREMPRDNAFDTTFTFLRDPYQFISKKCRSFRSDVYITRLMFHKTICMSGPNAAELFYDNNRFIRKDAMLMKVQKTLVGKGGVQSLDGTVHQTRKAMFMSVMTRERVANLNELTAGMFQTYALRWANAPQVVLYEQFQEILTRTACTWVGIQVLNGDVKKRTRQVSALFDAAGAIGPRHWKARLDRRKAERWLAALVSDVRANQITVPHDSVIRTVANFRDLDGHLLSPKVAAVELLNFIRPTAAVSVYMVFIAHALHRHPECRQRLVANDDEDYLTSFVQEVRRFYPFFPAVMARVKDDFDWEGYHFAKDTPVILDLYGTNHDERTFQAPDTFNPERFKNWDNSNPFRFIPQGGGNPNEHHRCAGEQVTIELMKTATKFLTKQIRYEVPSNQSLAIDMARLPAMPESKFIISQVQLVTQ
jgi:fatty-acid peroxygenase